MAPDGAAFPAPGGGAGRRALGRAPFVVLAVGLIAFLALGVWAGAALTAGSATQPRPLRVDVFTLVRTGIVYLDPATSDIVFQSEQRARETIGSDPWRNPQPSNPGVGPIRPWKEDRLIVGNPDHDVVAWLTRAGTRRGDIVVVEASTGNVLARTPAEGPPGASVVISSVDDEVLYYAIVDQNWPFPDVDSDDIRIWRWADGDAPRFDRHRSTVYFNDLSAGVAAIHVNAGLLFESVEGRTLSIVEPAGSGQTDFGGALSPDGRFWYGARSSQVVETATGKVFDLPVPEERSYGWTGSADLVLTVCDPSTDDCQAHTCAVARAGGPVCTPGIRWPESVGGNPYGVCVKYGLACGSRMPVL